MCRIFVKAAVAVTLCVPPAAVNGQVSSLQIDRQRVCLFAPGPVGDVVYTFPAHVTALETVARIVDSTGLQQNFVVVASDVPNAMAAMHPDGKQRYILYRQEFLSGLEQLGARGWPRYAILAHEIAHHLNFHLIGTEGDRPRLELEADRFSGYVLAKMGASLEQALVAVREHGSVEGTAEYPARSAREAAVTNGWSQASAAVQTRVETQPVLPGNYARTPNPGCINSGGPDPAARCVDVCVEKIPSGARILRVAGLMREQGSATWSDCGALGWCAFDVDWRPSAVPSPSQGPTRICGVARNWSHDRAREAQLVVEYMGGP